LNWTELSSITNENKLTKLKSKKGYLNDWEKEFVNDNPDTSTMSDKQTEALNKIYTKFEAKLKSAKRDAEIRKVKHCWLCDSSGIAYLVNRLDKQVNKFKCGCPHGSLMDRYPSCPSDFYVYAGGESIYSMIMNHKEWILENSREHFEALSLSYDEYLPGGEMHADYVRGKFKVCF